MRRVVVSGLNRVRFDAGDISSIAGVERCSQLFLGTTGPPGFGTANLALCSSSLVMRSADDHMSAADEYAGPK